MLKSIPVKKFHSNNVCIIDEEDKSVRGEYTTDLETESLIIRYPFLQIALMEEIVVMEDSMAHMPDLQEEGFGYNHDFATKEWDFLPILGKVFKQTWPVKDEMQNFIGFRTMSALPEARKMIRKLYAENMVDPIVTHFMALGQLNPLIYENEAFQVEGDSGEVTMEVIETVEKSILYAKVKNEIAYRKEAGFIVNHLSLEELQKDWIIQVLASLHKVYIRSYPMEGFLLVVVR